MTSSVLDIKGHHLVLSLPAEQSRFIIFPEHNSHSETNILPNAHRTLPNMSIPIMDFSAFRNGTEQERRELANRVTEEFKKHGATRLINHGISGEGMSYCVAPKRIFYPG